MVALTHPEGDRAASGPAASPPSGGRWLFSAPVDLAMLGVPLLLTLGACALAGSLFSAGIPGTYAGWASRFVLGNTTHVILTFLLLGARRDMLHATPGQAPTVLIGGAITWGISFAAYLLVDRYAHAMSDMLGAVVMTLAAHHTFSQSKGIWSLYAMRAAAPPSERERSLQRLYVPIGLILVMVRWLFVAAAPGRLFPFIGAVPGLEAPLPFWVTFVLAFAWVLFATITVRAVASGAGRSPKTLYVTLSACGVLAMIVTPVWGGVLVSGVHGMEYFLLSRRMLAPQPSERTGLGAGLVVPAMLLSVAPIIVAGVATGPFAFVGTPSRLATTAMFAVNAIVLAHYFADAFIFRFRIPAVRRTTLARLGFAQPSPAGPPAQPAA